MDRYPGYESMLTHVEHMKMQVKAQLPPEQSHLVDDLVAFVFDQVDECCNVATVDASTDTTEDYPLSDGPVTRGALADDTRIDVIGQANPQVNHQHEGSISSGQTVSPVPPPPTGTHSYIQTNIKVEVEDVSPVQSVQLCECVKKEEEDGGEYVMKCDCEDCETCRVKMEMKEELDESGETELGGNSSQVVQGCTRVKKEEDEDEAEVERPNKIQRIDRVVRNGPVGSPSRNVEYIDDQMPISSTSSFTIEDHTQLSQPVTIPLPIVTPTQSSLSSAHHVNDQLRDESLKADPRMDNVRLEVVEVGAEEFDREQVDEDNSTLNPMRTDQDDEEEEECDEAIEERDAPSAGPELQVPAENFVKRIEPADELGNRFECDYRGCGKRMKLKTNLINHIRTHTREKRFKCSVEGCDRAFVQKSQLDAHLNAHTGSRPFVCTWPGCEARFGQKSHLTEHTRTHTGERPFECDQCDATFGHQSSFATHLRTHTGARPFICTWPDCGHGFTTSSHLKIHSLVHSNERQFVCDVTGCTKVYKHKDALRRHKKAKHNLP